MTDSWPVDAQQITQNFFLQILLRFVFQNLQPQKMK